MPDPRGVHKQEGVTCAERYLAQLASKSFLSLWSYPNVYRNQGATGGRAGKEVCDLLVVFGNDVIIFSDKDCRFQSTDRLDLDWTRWFNRAVMKSANQVYGAERWLKENPGRLYVDRMCTQPLPIQLPDPTQLRFHRVVVAHDAARRCRELFRGSGSLVIFPALKADAHVAGPVQFPGCEGDIYEFWGQGLGNPAGYGKTVLPFAVGDLDPVRGFVHVFDDTGLDVVMRELDTTPDFVDYLRDREEYIRGGRLLMAAGEDDLLAHYLREMGGHACRSFYVADDTETMTVIPEGEWELLQRDPAWVARKQADAVSYVWDAVIERFNAAILDGSSAAYPFADFCTQELAVRAMAREPRMHRRILATSLGDLLGLNQDVAIHARVVGPIRQGSPHYIFLVVRPEPDEGHDNYQLRRFAIGRAYLIEGRRKLAGAKEIVVLATEPRSWRKWATEDVFYRGDEPLTHQEIESVRESAADQGILAKLGPTSRWEALEYPPAPAATQSKARSRQQSARNSQCPCGSGRKYKRCCIS